MPLKTNKNVKLYYTIREVSELLGVPESTLRYWETEFPNLRPKTHKATGVRQYAEEDIDQLRVIYNLVKVRGFKLAAARRMIQRNPQGAERTADVLETLIRLRDELKNLRIQLGAIA